MISVSLVLGIALIFLALQYRQAQSVPPATAPVPAPQSETDPVEPSPAPSDPAQTPEQTPTQTPDPTAGQALPAATPTRQNISANASAPSPKSDESETFKEFKPQTVYDIAQLPVPPQDDEKNFVEFMRKTRSEDPRFLSLRFRRCLNMIRNKDLWRDKEIKAFLRSALVCSAPSSASLRVIFSGIGRSGFL